MGQPDVREALIRRWRRNHDLSYEIGCGLHCYPKTKTNMSVAARNVHDGFSVFGCSRAQLGQLWRMSSMCGSGMSAGTQVHMDVSGRVPAELDAGMTDAMP